MCPPRSTKGQFCGKQVEIRESWKEFEALEIFLQVAPLQRLPQVRLRHSQEADGDSPRGASMLKRIFLSTDVELVGQNGIR